MGSRIAAQFDVLGICGCARAQIASTAAKRLHRLALCRGNIFFHFNI
jgi:hypothetical protein